MLLQEKISGTDTLLKLYVAIEEDLKALQPQLQAKHFPRDPRGGSPTLNAAEVLTILVWGAWRGLTDKAKLSFHVQTYHRQEFPTGCFRSGRTWRVPRRRAGAALQRRPPRPEAVAGDCAGQVSCQLTDGCVA